MSLVKTRIPTKTQDCDLYLYEGNNCCFVYGLGLNPLVRIHSSCFTGEILGSIRCDCLFQLEHAKSLMAQEKQGVLIYLAQEGRGIGLLDKLKAYNLQDQGLDTVEANIELQHPVDGREYNLAIKMLQDLEITECRLLTNNPLKIQALESKIKVNRVKVPYPNNMEVASYIGTKIAKMQHMK